MQQLFERMRLGLESITRTTPGWEGYKTIAIVLWLYLLAIVVAVFFVGRHFYKQGRWQANRLKCAVGVVLMIGAVGFFPVTFYNSGARQQAAHERWQQYVADAPTRQTQARVQAVSAFKERIAKFKSAQRSYYSLPHTYTAPNGSVLPVTVTYRDLGQSASSAADTSDHDGSMLVTHFTIGEQQFILTEHIPRFNTYNYSYCVNNSPDCLFTTRLGQAHCANFTVERDTCQLLFNIQHYLSIEANGPAVIHPSKIYDTLALTTPENIPLTTLFTHCPISPGCMPPQRFEEIITEQSLQ